MAQMINQHGEAIYLNRYHIFGRDTQIATTELPCKSCSKFHAAIYFENNKWFIEDRSLNGLVINNSLIHMKKMELSSVKTLRFSTTDKEEWQIEDLRPPVSYLFNANEQSVLLAEEVPQVIYQNRNFRLCNHSTWYVENEHDKFQLHGGESLYYNGINYNFIMNDPIEEAEVLLDYCPDFGLTFELRSDYEEVDVTLELFGSKTEIRSKSFNFLWYLLAKKVHHDEALGLPATTIGWIETDALLALLNKECKQDFDSYYLNLQIHRIRKQLMQIDPKYDYFFTDLIQRRKGEIRMNPVKITIHEPVYELYAELA